MEEMPQPKNEKGGKRMNPWWVVLVVLGIAWGIWALENFAGISIRPRRGGSRDTVEPMSVWFPLIATALAPFVGYFWSRSVKSLEENLLTVEAEVVKIGKIPIDGTRRLTFTYVVNGKSYKKYKSVKTRITDRLNIGDKFPIEINGNKPGSCRVKDENA